MEATIKEKISNNCDELLTHLFKACSDTVYASGGNIIFQGDICEIGGFMPDRWCILMPSTKFPKTVFAIDDYSEDGQFFLYIFKGKEFILDQTLAVKLPNYIKEELIEILKEE